MSHLIGIYLVQVATILITAALYKSIQRGIKYTPGGSQLSPMRPRSILAGKSPSFRSLDSSFSDDNADSYLVFIPLDVVWGKLRVPRCFEVNRAG